MKLYSCDDDPLPSRVKKNRDNLIVIFWILTFIVTLSLFIYFILPEKAHADGINKNLAVNLKPLLIQEKPKEKQMPVGEYLPKPKPEPLSEERPDIVIDTYIGEASHYNVASSSDSTASMEPLIDSALTCALPPSIGQGRFGMRVRVTNLETGLSVVVRYNDSGPYSNGRIIDLTDGSQQAIGMNGIAQVKIELLHTEMSAGSNNFAYGYCTDYVASKVPVVWNGDAKEWYWQAISAGYKTGTTPSVGAILCTDESWWGHVAYVEAVYTDGTIQISEKNYAGWNVTSTRQIACNSGKYIY